MVAASPNPYLLFLPYLPLERSYTFGPWQIGPLKNYNGPWLSAEFEQLSKIFLASFRDADGKPLDNIYLLNHGTKGMDGKLPTRPQRVAIQRAVEFAVLDKALPSDNPNAGWGTATSDNTELFIWPIDVTSGHVTLSRGSMVSLHAGGHKIDEKLVVPAPLELHMPWSTFSIDGELLAAMYHLFTRRLSGPDDVARRRIETATGWLAKAWRNSPSVRMEDRIVLLKTGFEALSGKSKSYDCAVWLKDLYETHLGGLNVDDTKDILWSPKETARHPHSYMSRGRVVNIRITDLQRWFLTFSEARNAIIHDGIVPRLTYRVGKSRYNGSLVNTGERLLRESIKVSMVQLGYPNLWREELWRAVDKALAKGRRRKKTP